MESAALRSRERQRRRSSPRPSPTPPSTSPIGLDKLYRRVGKRPQAQEHLATAGTMFREMDMRFWLAPAEAELAALG